MSNIKQSFNLPVNSLALSKGFSLVELMVVVIILTVFASMMSLSVGSSNARKNRAFYEHLINSLNHVRLLSAENMQPMGMVLKADNQGQIQPVIVKLDNPYMPYANTSHGAGSVGSQGGRDSVAKNAMELSGMTNNAALNMGQKDERPTWVVADDVKMPKLPNEVEVSIVALEHPTPNSQAGKTLQPWFQGNDVPKALWFGTGGATPVRIEVRYQQRLVGDAITITPDGRVIMGDDK